MIKYLSVLTIALNAANLMAQAQAGTVRIPSVDPESPPVASIISALPVRNVGPMTGSTGYRLGDVSVYEANPKIFYYSSANGGVLKTIDGGRTSQIVFDKIGSASIGSIAVSQKNPDLIWVGTGDRWQRNSVGMGDGVYKSTDGGKTWQDMGLKESISVGRVAVHPQNNDIVFVAALGSPWGASAQRGLYKSKDGGRTWKRVVFVNETTGAVDIIIDPKNPSNMLASMWDHIHRPWGYFPTGPGSGIFRSTDGGETWQRVSKGLPKSMGRIAIDYFRPDPRHVVAAVEAAYPATGIYRSMDGGATWVEMPALHYNDEGQLENQKKQGYWYRPHYNQVVRFSTKDVNTIYHGSVGHVSHDGGKTWKGFTGDNHELWIDPNDPNHWIDLTDAELHQGWDLSHPCKDCMYARTPSLFQTYGIGYDMRKLYWVMGNAQDAGNGFLVPTQGPYGYVSSSEVVPVRGTEAGRAMADPEDWTTVYSLDGGHAPAGNDLISGRSWKTDTWKPRGVFDRETHSMTYTKEQRLTMPRMPPREAPGFEISPWNSQTLYLARNFLFKSTNRGDSWEQISPDLTRNKPEWQAPDGSVYGESGGVTSYPTINSISESPLKQDMIWVGTGDGYVQLTMDGGKTWTNLTKNIPGLPDTSWVSRIQASRHKVGRAYVTFDNHRNVDLKPYVYVTEDSGKTWTNISSNLPQREPVRVIEEGQKNPDLLYVGTEYGLWISLDRGKQWTRYQDYRLHYQAPSSDAGREEGYLPSVAVHDLHIHPRELDLILGLHGRGFWIMPARALEEMTVENRAKDVYFASPGNIYLFPTHSSDGVDRGSYRSSNTQPGVLFSYYLKKDAAKNEALITITSAGGSQVLTPTAFQGTAKAGLNSIRFSTSMLYGPVDKPGDYRVVLTIDGKEYYQTLHVEDATDEVIPAAARR